MDAIQATSTPVYRTIAASSHSASCGCATCSRASSSTTSTGNGSSASSSAVDSVNLTGQGQSTGSNAGPQKAGAHECAAPTDSAGKPLDRARQAQLTEMKKTDGDVRRHEQAHLAASGGLAQAGSCWT